MLPQSETWRRAMFNIRFAVSVLDWTVMRSIIQNMHADGTVEDLIMKEIMKLN
jgi:hypothetical protein